MASSPSCKLLNALQISIFLILSFALSSSASPESQNSPRCESEHRGQCHNMAEALKLKIIAIASILVASMTGVCLPMFSRAVPALAPDKDLFVLIKSFSSGVILATGYMHVLPDSWESLGSECLPEDPWRKFPFTTFVAMLSAVATLMVDSFTMSWHRKRFKNVEFDKTSDESRKELGNGDGQIVNASDHEDGGKTGSTSVVLRHRVVAQVLELGIVVHSVVIGLAMGASENQCTIRPLIAALCFHQLFEGMGLGGCILQADYGAKMKAVMVFFFSTTTPLGIVLGIGLSKVYSDTSPTALIVVGVLDACSAGLLNYMALVDLLASDFMGPKLQSNIKLQGLAYVAVLLGVGLMSLMAKWA